MSTFRYTLATLVMLICCSAISGRAVAANDAIATMTDEQQLIEILESDAEPGDKGLACKRLAVFGSEQCVPAVAQLLGDKELNSWARITLEVIPGDAASQALREAVPNISGRELVGVINSLGVRADGQATDVLQGKLADTDPDVAAATAVALGRIGNDQARAALEKALTESATDVRSAVAEGCILCAEQLLASGKLDEAARLYEQVRQADVPRQRQLEAVRGLIMAAGADVGDVLSEQLASEDAEQFGIAVRTTRELGAPQVTAALIKALQSASAERQATLVSALADRTDPTVVPAILELAEQSPKNLRGVALDMLAKVGDASCVPVLLRAVAGDDPELASIAVDTLASLEGDDIDQAIVERLEEAEGSMRAAVIRVIGQRRIDAVPALLAAAKERDPAIRSAALTALGETIDLARLDVLVGHLANSRGEEDFETAQRALRAAAIRMPDRDACAEVLVAGMKQASQTAQTAIVETLGAVGGDRALRAVGAAAGGDAPELQDVASRVLGEWMTADAGPVLLELAQNVDEQKYRIRALRGYIRIARQFNLPIEKRAEMCRKAWNTAQRDAEKSLVLTVLARYPSPEMLSIAMEAAEDDKFKETATRVALEIAQELGGNAVDAKQLMALVQGEPAEIEIVRAEYGAGDNTKDVTAELKRHVGTLPLITLPVPRYNEVFGGDPAPGVVKTLRVEYRFDGQAGTATFPENGVILLPKPNDE